MGDSKFPFDELTFFSQASHDFKEPINSILAYVNLALRESKSKEENEKLNKYLEKTSFSALALLDLINDMLTWSSVKQGVVKLNVEEFELDSFLQLCVDGIHETFKTKPIELVLDFPKSPITLFQDKMKLRRVITNLVVNAYKYTDKGTITLKIGPENEKISVSVRDTGCGIEEANLKKVFIPFMKLSDEKVTGTGLGLAVANQFTQMLGGSISVVSEVGKGSEFTFCVPKNLDVIEAMEGRKI